MILSMLALCILAASCGTTTSTTGTTDGTTAGTTTTTTTTTTAHQAHADVPVTINTAFMTQYPDATNVMWSPYDKVVVPIDWEMTGWPALDGGDYVVTFERAGQKYYAWYDASGTWIGTTSMLTNHSNLPVAVSTLLSTKYSGYNIEKIEQEWDKSRTVYEIKLKKSDDDKIKLHVTEQGAVLKEKMKD